MIEGPQATRIEDDPAGMLSQGYICPGTHEMSRPPVALANHPPPPIDDRSFERTAR
ncbi:hypothetical protein [Nocardia sp. CS682]|uniref:hypothetical protein n=1 Tax=Nocardia sp. CS682 TaxID=1047172 RepID=UPI00142FC167|nr:hypothetical protein [Nocardia sp. CS682]